MHSRQKMTIQRYRHWYAGLLRLYGKAFYTRFGRAMEQTFVDLLQERAESQKQLWSLTLWLFIETGAGMLRQHLRRIFVERTDLMKVFVGTAILLLVPAVAMQFSDQVAWGPGDFVIAGLLLISTGLAYTRLAKKVNLTVYKIAVGMAVLSCLMLVWTNLAVGLIGSEDNPANLMYFAVLGTGIAGALLARFQPQGLATTLFSMAAVQAVIAIIAIAAGLHQTTGSSMTEILNINGFFAILFLVSAVLFRHASQVGKHLQHS